jgi:hypothetical protein
MNGAAPEPATKSTVQNQTANTSVIKSAASRVPEKHPWLGVAGIEEKSPNSKGRTT